MTLLFYTAGFVAIASTLMVIVQLNAVHALLYLIVSLFSVAVIFFALGAPFVAALEIIIYAGAIMVLFIFVIMMLNLGPRAVAQESRLLNRRMWVGPAILAGLLLVELAAVLLAPTGRPAMGVPVGPKEVSLALYGPYLIGVELASLLLLAGLLGAYHLGSRHREAGPDEGGS